MRKIIIFLFILILSGCSEPVSIYILIVTINEVELKFIFNKKFVTPINISTMLPISYENDTREEYRRIKVKENTKSIIINPNEKIRLGCGSNYGFHSSCIYEEYKHTNIESIEITNLGLKKKIILNRDNFYDSRNFFWADTIYIKESMFK